MSVMARVEDKYLERISSIQQSIHQRSQIKGSKLHGYLKKICVREAQAKMRNLELLRDVECLQIKMQQYNPSLFSLQQQKVEFSTKIYRFMEESKTTGNSKLKSVQGDCKDSSLSQIAKDFTNASAVISMGYQTSRGAYHPTGNTSVLSHQALHCSPNRSMSSCERLPSGPLKDFTIVREEATANPAHLSDDISAPDPDNPPDGHNLTDKQGKRLATLRCVQTATVPFGDDDEQEPEPATQVTFRILKKNPSLGSNNNPMGLQNPPAEHINSTPIAPETPLMENSARGFSHLIPETAPARKSEDISGRSESSNSSTDAQVSESSASDLSISLSESESEDDEPESEAVARNTGPDGIWRSPVSTLKNTSHSLSLEGLFKLINSIEERLQGEQTRVYGNCSIDERHFTRIISLCDSEAGLNEEDLEACGAVVLHELQRLSLSTERGCLLPHELVSAHPFSIEDMAVSLPPDATRLWDRWFKHALLLKESHVLSTERLVELFTPLLVERHATYHHQAKVLLRTFLSRSSEECPSADEESDSPGSCGPPSLPPHCGSVKPARRIQKQQIQELQSAEEESHDESPVESVRIRETKAYRLLKLSAMQERLPSSEEEEKEEGEQDDPSEINHCPEVDLGRAKCSSHQDPYPCELMSDIKRRMKLDSKYKNVLCHVVLDNNYDFSVKLRLQ
ncbi:centrosomal protein kizuna isoform X2 [Syngnathoides biaculeatus]|uniref:centrosomal protein kizuna isoform X2 n=1 Tax=Syngnathoides biaculeatus TaxID=300417 RepID=UPI002ADDF6B2|nr:centrosomal protein kizuna isoform X2 [Syngnathoides biaculeatus]